jgi:putative hydrolase of the HAD superfamily
MNFLFDIGNVIVGVDFIPALMQLIPKGTDKVEERLDTLIERKDEFEAGRIDAADYYPWAAETLNFQAAKEPYIRAWKNIFTPNLPMWESIENLHAAGHRLILFSNIQEVHKNHLLEHYPIFQKFAGGIYSYETGHIKPEPEIYQLAIDQYNLTPENTGYIDDLPANIAGGQSFGFLCHQYDVCHHAAFTQWLDDLP